MYIEDREQALVQWHRQVLTGMEAEIDRLVQSPAKYLDPDFSREPSTGKPLFERARDQRIQIAQDVPHLRARLPAMMYRFPDGLGESLSRSDLVRLRGEIHSVIELLQAK